MLGLMALAAVVGHVYPIFFKFKGGKGVATGLGCLLAMSPLLGIIGFVTWIVIAAIFRYASLAALVTFVLVPFYSLFLATPAYFIPLIAMTTLIVWRHRTNIQNLRTGQERKLGYKEPLAK